MEAGESATWLPCFIKIPELLEPKTEILYPGVFVPIPNLSFVASQNKLLSLDIALVPVK